MILYKKIYERESNDAWLIDHVKLSNNFDELFLIHHKRWIGWDNPIIEDNTINLDINNIIKSQKIINDFIDDNSLCNGNKGIKINLKEIL